MALQRVTSYANALEALEECDPSDRDDMRRLEAEADKALSILTLEEEADAIGLIEYRREQERLYYARPITKSRINKAEIARTLCRYASPFGWLYSVTLIDMICDLGYETERETLRRFLLYLLVEGQIPVLAAK
jgi:hypothetical protein